MEQIRVNTGLSRELFLKRWKASNLISPADVDRAAAAIPTADGKAFANALIASGLVTAYQIEAIDQQRFTELLIGNYEVLDKLGAGGMGTVYKARHRRMKRIVALKVLSRALCKENTFVQRFQREVETIAKLSHPNIVMAYDADEGEVGHFLVMEYVHGADLASLVQKQGPCSVASAVSFILQAARGLAYAHQEKIIHRDIKPANLLCDVAGVIKVTDLGLARFNPAATGASANTGITQAGGVLGTVDYMPPEQAIDSTNIDHRADIYSLGATLYYLLTGEPPFQGPTVIATLLKHRDAPIPSLIVKRKEVPAELDAVFSRMLAKSPGDRFQSMTDVAADLEAIQGTLEDSKALQSTVVLPKHAVPALQPTEIRNNAGASTFPTEMQAFDQTIDLKPTQAPPGKKAAVLLVEPSRTQAGIIRRFLQEQGVQTVFTAATGQDALKIVRSDSPTAIVSALHLPDMTGIQLASQARAENKGAHIGFVLISSEGESKDASSPSKSKLAVHLHKPFTQQQLIEALSMASAQAVQAGLPSPSGASAVAEQGERRVLIVDDSPAARMHIRNVLRGLGLTELVDAADGAQAVAAIAKESFDLIVTDYNMPHMDGGGLVGYLKQNPATVSVPIIMVTTETDPGKLDAVRRLGVTVCEKAFATENVRKILSTFWS